MAVFAINTKNGLTVGDLHNASDVLEHLRLPDDTPCDLGMNERGWYLTLVLTDQRAKGEQGVTDA